MPGQCPKSDFPSARSRVPPEQQDVFGQFERHHAGQFADDDALVSAFEEVRDKESPWPVGFTPKTQTMNAGEEIRMIVNRGAENTPGRFATTDDIPNSSYGRNILAIKEEWKETLDLVVTYRLRKSLDVLSGPVGPQIERLPDGRYNYLPGGGASENKR